MDSFLDLTDRFPMRFDVDRMQAEVAAVQSERIWQQHYDKTLSTGWAAIPLVSQHGRMDGPDSQRWGDVREFRRTPMVAEMPYFRQLLDAFACSLGRVRILKLDPGAKVGMHRDMGDEAAGYAFHKVRLHIPIQTNERVNFYLGGRSVRMAVGRLYYCDFTQTHAVYNDGTEPRLHLVLDLIMNDFLRGLFPAETPWDRVSHAWQRAVMPAVWAVMQRRGRLSRRFWQAYNGSAAQTAVATLRGKGRDVAAVRPGVSRGGGHASRAGATLCRGYAWPGTDGCVWHTDSAQTPNQVPQRTGRQSPARP